ncbi:MAG: helix-turn-helix transcriptional regulator [Gammaproteobacteria bacterium]
MPENLMDYLPLGVMLVSPDGTLDQVNHAAQRLLSRGDTFRVAEGKLRLVDPDLEDHFSAFRRGSGPERMLMRMMRRSSRREPHLVLAQQVADGEAVLLLVMDGEDRGRLTEKMLISSLGLTRAEARVALGAIHGHAAPRIAKALKLSPHTVRAHLKHVFRKLGINSQKELVIMTMKMSLLTCAPRTLPRAIAN